MAQAGLKPATFRRPLNNQYLIKFFKTNITNLHNLVIILTIYMTESIFKF